MLDNGPVVSEDATPEGRVAELGLATGIPGVKVEDVDVEVAMV